MALKPKLSTGNLTPELVKTVVQFGSKSDFKPAEDKLPADCRWSLIAYKVSEAIAKKAETQDVDVPANFAIAVPQFVFDGANEQHVAFARALAQDYQDKVIHDVADKKSAANPLDWTQTIAGYFDRSKSGGLTKKSIMEWFDSVWSVAYMVRLTQLNALADTKKLTDAEMTKRVANYRSWCDSILSGKAEECLTARSLVSTVRQTTEKLAELGLMVSCPESQHIVDRCLAIAACPDPSEDI